MMKQIWVYPADPFPKDRVVLVVIVGDPGNSVKCYPSIEKS